MQRPPANWPTRYWPWSSVEDKSRTFPTAILAEPFSGAAPPFGSKDEDEDEESEEAEASLTIVAEPFPGAAPPFVSKDEDDDPDEGTLDPKDEDEDSEEAEASFYTWACDTMTSDPTEHEDAVDHSKDGEARDNSFPETRYPHDRVGGSRAACAKPPGIILQACLVGNCLGFMTNALRLVAKDTGQPGITSPISKLPPAPPGAAEKAKERSKRGRGVEGDGEEGVDPMSTLDQFNWDSLPLPGLGQI